MAFRQEETVREVHAISDEEKIRIVDFLQGAVYCWCKNRKSEWFSIRDLMGGENFYWEGTPLIALYTKHQRTSIPEADAVKRAGEDAGWLLKRAIGNDRRQFETKKEEQIRKYQWIENK